MQIPPSQNLVFIVIPLSELVQTPLTEFQPKRGGLSLTLIDQGQTNNPKINPSGYPTKFFGLLGR